MIVLAAALTPDELTALSQSHLPTVVVDPLSPPGTPVVSVGSTNFAGGMSATQHLLALGHRRIAYLGGRATAAFISIVGFDDTLASIASPPLTTVRQPLREMGIVALRTALRLPVGEKVEFHHIELATELVVRESSLVA
jgi:DNA-binding LacI/PurR family transcriptional regulator